MNKSKISIFWFRRDLRLNDNAGLYHALRSELPVLPIFIFDTDILNQLDDKSDRRVQFIHNSITNLHSELSKYGSGLLVKTGRPIDVFKELFEEYDIMNVYTNHDYEPYAIFRDKTVEDLCKSKGATFLSCKDQCIFEKNEIIKDDGSPYSVFTPYSKKWLNTLNDFHLKSYPTQKYFNNLHKSQSTLPTIEDIGFTRTDFEYPESSADTSLIKEYNLKRDFPGEPGTSRLGVHLRFGTISIRELAFRAKSLSDTYLKELIWRDFYMMILYHYPQVVDHAFKPQYDFIEWINDEAQFTQWCEGNTGYPIVDAGMRELNTTGFMHNRVRMIVASFLTKHLLIDWRWGEAYFAKKLLDYDLSANNGGWQWAAGCGCDAAPYFRVFNPSLQMQKFDPQMRYVKKWVPELTSISYPKPIVDHDFARKRVLNTYKKALTDI